MAKKRRDINALTEAQLDDYVHALGILRARSVADPDDPTGYAFQAALHNDVFVGPCEHGSDAFLPWHRAHLHYFEQLLQAADPPRTADVTIPYWDWIHEQPTGKFPPSFDKPGLSDPDRDLRPAELPPDTLAIVTTETDQAQFAGFPDGDPFGDYGRLEEGPHNYMHPEFIGGKMADPGQAAEDPIYWSFHCFIDLMWAEWQRRNGAPPLTSPDLDLRGFLDQPKHKSGDFHDTLDLGYTYAYSDQLATAFGVGAAPPIPRELVTSKPMESVSGDDIPTQLRDTERLQFRFSAPPEEGRRLVVRLNELKVPRTGSFMMRAYAHPRDVEFRTDDDFAERYGVGYVVMWRAHLHDGDHHGGHGGHGDHDGGHGHGDGHGDHDHGGQGHGDAPPPAHHPTSCTARFDVTSVVDATPASVEDHVLTLRYIPLPSGMDQADQPAELIEEVMLKNVMMEVYA
ncbi:tyrosinase family protein [Streptomyces sp. NPDC058052]|uniref:tyrosinase family protein n=1 Tax=Streptomyces sp. NPDC058052 TaxID=3346316 RepID=UPI0036EDCD26